MLSFNPNVQLRNLPLETLQAMVDEADVFLFKHSIDGEDYAAMYKKYPGIFDTLIRKTVTLKNKVNAHFKDEADRLIFLANIHIVKADELEQQLFTPEIWEEEDNRTSTVLFDALWPIIFLGVQYAEQDFSYDSIYVSEPPKLQKIMRSYTTKLGPSINDTTREIILQQVKTSIDLGETRIKLIERLTPLIGNEKRALKIAQTESVRIFAKGRFEVAVEIGLGTKTWEANPGACTICRELHGQTRKIDEDFYSKTLGAHVSSEPAHPHCRCGVRYKK